MVKLLTESRRTDMMSQGIRDLFAAGWLGEQMFAQLGLHRAVSVLSDPRERTKVIGASWRNERLVGRMIEIGLLGASVIDLVRAARRRRWLDFAASTCAIGAIGTAIANEVSGRLVGHAEGDHDTPIETGFRSSAETPQSARAAQKAILVLAPVGIGLAAASIGLSIAARSID